MTFVPGDEVVIVKGRSDRPSAKLVGLRCVVVHYEPNRPGECLLEPLSVRPDTNNRDIFYYPRDKVVALPASRDPKVIEAWLST